MVAGFGQRLAAGETPESGTLMLSPMRMAVTGPGGEARLTQAEAVLLAAFARAPQQSHERRQVAAQLGQGDTISRENIDVKLARLRKKLIACGIDAPAIQSLRGVGYRLCSPVRVRSE